MKESGAPQIAFVGVTAALLGAVKDLGNFFCRNRERGMAFAQFHPQRRQTKPARRGNFVAVPERCQLVGTGCSGVDRSFVMAKMKRGSQFQTGPCSAGQNAVTHVHRVLQMRKNDSFLKNDAADVIGPTGSPSSSRNSRRKSAPGKSSSPARSSAPNETTSLL